MHALSAAFKFFPLISTEKQMQPLEIEIFILEGICNDLVMNGNGKQQLWSHSGISQKLLQRFWLYGLGCSLGCNMEICIFKVTAYLSFLLSPLQKMEPDSDV